MCQKSYSLCGAPPLLLLRRLLNISVSFLFPYSSLRIDISLGHCGVDIFFATSGAGLLAYRAWLWRAALIVCARTHFSQLSASVGALFAAAVDLFIYSPLFTT
jgi:hypothetical protein